MNKKPKKRRPVTIHYGQGLSLPDLTKGEALKIAAELLQEYEFIQISQIQDYNKTQQRTCDCAISSGQTLCCNYCGRPYLKKNV
jgi:hypothetical protein